MRKLFFLTFISSICFAQSPIGKWSVDKASLPVYQYKAGFPFSFSKPNLGKQNPDPFFILGNYRVTLFAHASGQYEFITFDRTVSRLNRGDSILSGANYTSIFIDGVKYSLTGTNPSALTAGIGFVTYTYSPTKNISINKTISILPSEKPNTGIPAFLITLEIINKGKTVNIKIEESVRANYDMAYQDNPHNKKARKVEYTSTIKYIDEQTIKADFTASSKEPYLWKNKQEYALYDGFPPSLFLKSISENSIVKINKDLNNFNCLTGFWEGKLPSGKSQIYKFVVGLTHNEESKDISNFSESYSTNSDFTFRKEWKQTLPSFEEEKNDTLKRELIWSAHTLHAMSKYSTYFEESKIPLGSSYDYHWGLQVCTRDHAHLLLPAMYYDTAFAKSGLKYLLKRMNKKGEVHMSEVGFGMVTHGALFGSDNQLYMLWALAEWFRITQDARFLLTETDYYPVKSGANGTTLEKIEILFTYFRDEIGRGPNGWIRNLNSDWSDDVHFVSNTAAFNRNWENSESMTNTAMTCVVFKTLSDELDKIAQKPEFNTQRKRIENLSEAIKYFREGLLNAVKKEWEGRNFLTAYHLVGQDWGKEKIFLLPNAFALQIPEIENIKKEKLFSEIENRILKNEKLGARNREEPQTDGMHYAKPGSGENGGFWWVPNSQLILGVNTFNKSKAKELFNKMSLHNYSKNYPNYWVGQWSASDAVQSSIGEFEGYQGYTYSSLQPAFKIYLWNRLREK